MTTARSRCGVALHLAVGATAGAVLAVAVVAAVIGEHHRQAALDADQAPTPTFPHPLHRN